MSAQSVPAKIKSQRSDPQNSPREVRVAYPYFHEKRTKNAAGVPFVYGPDHPKAGEPNPRYSVSFMFPKLGADAAQCANYNWLWSLAVEAAKKMWPQNVDASGNWMWPDGAHLAINDGDIPYKKKLLPGQPAQSAEDAALKNAWRRGYWIVEAENFLTPGPRIAKIANGRAEDLPAKEVNGTTLYKSGDFGFPNMHAYAYQNRTFGVNFGFDGFCFTREGDPIGSTGPRSTEQMFGSLPVSSVAPPLPPTHAAPPVAPVAAPPLPPASPPTAPLPPGLPAFPQPVGAR